MALLSTEGLPSTPPSSARAACAFPRASGASPPAVGGVRPRAARLGAAGTTTSASSAKKDSSSLLRAVLPIYDDLSSPAPPAPAQLPPGSAGAREFGGGATAAAAAAFSSASSPYSSTSSTPSSSSSPSSSQPRADARRVARFGQTFAPGSSTRLRRNLAKSPRRVLRSSAASLPTPVPPPPHPHSSSVGARSPRASWPRAGWSSPSPATAAAARASPRRLGTPRGTRNSAAAAAAAAAAGTAAVASAAAAGLSASLGTPTPPPSPLAPAAAGSTGGLGEAPQGGTGRSVAHIVHEAPALPLDWSVKSEARFVSPIPFALFGISEGRRGGGDEALRRQRALALLDVQRNWDRLPRLDELFLPGPGATPAAGAAGAAAADRAATATPPHTAAATPPRTAAAAAAVGGSSPRRAGGAGSPGGATGAAASPANGEAAAAATIAAASAGVVPPSTPPRSPARVPMPGIDAEAVLTEFYRSLVCWAFPASRSLLPPEAYLQSCRQAYYGARRGDPNAAGAAKYYGALSDAFHEAFVMLYDLLCAGEAPFFYFADPKEATVLFLGRGVGGRPLGAGPVAFIDRSRRRFRDLLCERRVPFSMPRPGDRKMFAPDVSALEDELRLFEGILRVARHAEEEDPHGAPRPPPLLVVSGEHAVAALVSVLLADTEVHGAIPSLLSPVGFCHASLCPARITSNAKYLGASSYGQDVQAFCLMLEGPLLPHSIFRLCRLLRAVHGPFDVLFTSVKGTTRFNWPPRGDDEEEEEDGVEMGAGDTSGGAAASASSGVGGTSETDDGGPTSLRAYLESYSGFDDFSIQRALWNDSFTVVLKPT